MKSVSNSLINGNRKELLEKSVLLLSDNTIASGNRYLMSSLLAKSIPVNMVIYKFDHDNNTESLLRLMSALNVGIVGISLFSTRRLEFKSISDRIRTEFPGTVIVCGGPDVNSNYLNVIDWADFVCLFDGEVAFPDLCIELLKNTPKKDIRVSNIFYKLDNKIPHLVQNQLQIESNLDKYSFPYFSDENIFLITSGSILSHKDSLQNIYNVYASRGCPYKCTYCANHVFTKNFPGGKYYRYRSVYNVIDEILSVLSKMPQIRSITFHDEQFGVNNRWLDEFVVKYKAHVNMPFFVQINPLSINKEKIKKLKDIGLVSMSFGMQSASERIRKLYARPESLDHIIRANHILHELRINHFFDVITDNPYENVEDIEETLRFLLSLKKPFVAKTFDLVHLPNTKLTDMLLRDNKITSNQIEGNFKYEKEIDWRVKEKNVTMDTDEKYLVALIQMTGNVFYPNAVIKVLRALRKLFPEIFKKIITRMVLTSWFFKSQMMINAAVSLGYDKKYGVLFSKLAKKFAKLLRF